MREIHYKKPKKLRKDKKEAESKQLVKSILTDFEQRKIARRAIENQWRLNLDFYAGRQNTVLTSFDTIVTVPKQFFWQSNQSFNHIAGVVESRLAKITGSEAEVEPVVEDEGQAEKCKEILNSVFEKQDFADLTEQATMWSEVTGTAFYKVMWEAHDVSIRVCSPFEIYPDCLDLGDMGDVTSLVHAKNMTVAQIKENWDIDLSGYGEKELTVVEYHEVSSKQFPNGRLVIIAGESLLHEGELPYINQKDGIRGLPFIRQTSEGFLGNFFGRSVVERAIPVQRAYNSIKNRKVEFLNRLACGVLVAEEGSIDLESLEEDGLAPGKVIVYRHGTTPPRFLDTGTIPTELEREEDRLLREFELISGGGEVARLDGASSSGLALSILAEQSDRRMSRVIASVHRAKANVASHVLRLVKQFKRENIDCDSVKISKVASLCLECESEILPETTEVVTSEKTTKEELCKICD